jgi:hypothetical protein
MQTLSLTAEMAGLGVRENPEEEDEEDEEELVTLELASLGVGGLGVQPVLRRSGGKGIGM